MATINSTSMYGVSIQLKYKNASDWQDSDTLLAGEIGLELDTKKAKLGDGTKTWGQLDYYSDPVVAGLVESLTSRVQTNEGDITTIKGQIESLQSTDTTHTSDISTLKGNIQTINATDEAQQKDIDALKGITVISANPAPVGA